jgi:hypothetical protein
MECSELVALYSRTWVLENLVPSPLSTAAGQQLKLTRDMGTVITPRAGFIRHPLTAQAAAHMIKLIERAESFRSCETSRQ